MRYVALAAVIAAGVGILHTGDAAATFALSVITSIMLGIVVSMNVYVFKNSRVKQGASLFPAPP